MRRYAMYGPYKEHSACFHSHPVLAALQSGCQLRSLRYTRAPSETVSRSGLHRLRSEPRGGKAPRGV